MKNYLVITLGTREIQILKDKAERNGFESITEGKFSHLQNKKNNALKISVRSSNEFPDYYTISPRIDGKFILENLQDFRPLLEFPLIDPALEYLKEKQVTINIIMLVYTDQLAAYDTGKVKKKENINNDTLYFAEILEKLIKEDFHYSETEIHHFGVFEDVTDIAFQYDNFARIKEHLLYPDEVRAVYLFPQGGIDSINQALTLRLIETFKTKLKQIQNAEGAGVRELDFPTRFLNTLNKQKIQKHLDDYDFGAIDKGLHSDKTVHDLAQYAYKKLHLQYNQLKTDRQALSNYSFQDHDIDDNEKLKDLYLSAKINLHQRKYTEFLWRVYTLNELIFKIPLKKLLGKVVDEKSQDTNSSVTPWQKALNSINPEALTLLKNSKGPNGKAIDTTNPNRWAFKVLFNYFTTNDQIQMSTEQLNRYNVVSEKLEDLTYKRNQIAHKLGSIDIAEINKILKKTNLYTVDNLISDLDQIFETEGFGIYDKIKEEIERLL